MKIKLTVTFLNEIARQCSRDRLVSFIFCISWGEIWLICPAKRWYKRSYQGKVFIWNGSKPKFVLNICELYPMQNCPTFGTRQRYRSNVLGVFSTFRNRLYRNVQSNKVAWEFRYSESKPLYLSFVYLACKG